MLHQDPRDAESILCWIVHVTLRNDTAIFVAGIEIWWRRMCILWDAIASYSKLCPVEIAGGYYIAAKDGIIYYYDKKI